MILVHETTVWSDDTPNHTYLLSDNKATLYAYSKEVDGKDGELFWFSKPMPFSTKGRTFVILRRIPTDDRPANTTSTVVGSKGDIYTITTEPNGNKSCSCPGFMYRGKCKHIGVVAIPTN
jgi:hypothetical protein